MSNSWVCANRSISATTPGSSSMTSSTGRALATRSAHPLRQLGHDRHRGVGGFLNFEQILAVAIFWWNFREQQIAEPYDDRKVILELMDQLALGCWRLRHHSVSRWPFSSSSINRSTCLM